MKLLEIIFWMGAAAQVYHCPLHFSPYVVKLDGRIISAHFERPSRSDVIIAIEKQD